MDSDTEGEAGLQIRADVSARRGGRVLICRSRGIEQGTAVHDGHLIAEFGL
jgi:hypothetical protein